MTKPAAARPDGEASDSDPAVVVVGNGATASAPTAGTTKKPAIKWLDQAEPGDGRPVDGLGASGKQLEEMISNVDAQQRAAQEEERALAMSPAVQSSEAAIENTYAQGNKWNQEGSGQAETPGAGVNDSFETAQQVAQQQQQPPPQAPRFKATSASLKKAASSALASQKTKKKDSKMQKFGGSSSSSPMGGGGAMGGGAMGGGGMMGSMMGMGMGRPSAAAGTGNPFGMNTQQAMMGSADAGSGWHSKATPPQGMAGAGF